MHKLVPTPLQTACVIPGTTLAGLAAPHSTHRCPSSFWSTHLKRTGGINHLKRHRRLIFGQLNSSPPSLYRHLSELSVFFCCCCCFFLVTYKERNKSRILQHYLLQKSILHCGELHLGFFSIPYLIKVLYSDQWIFTHLFTLHGYSPTSASYTQS